MGSGGSWYELFVGLRYLRARSRNGLISFISLTSILGITLGVAVLIVVLSVMNGFETEVRERILSVTAHATITGAGGVLSDWSEVRESALTHPEVLDAAPYIEGEGMLVRGGELSGVMVRGILPERERGVSSIGDKLNQGSLEGLQAGEYRVVLGDELAKALGVGVGDRVVLVISQGNVTPVGIVPRMKRFRVTGVFSAGMYEFDRNMALIHMADAARLFRLGEEASGVALRVEDMFGAPRVVREVALGLDRDPLYVGDWTRRHVNFFRSIQLTKTVLFVILLAVVGVAAFNIVSTLVMVVKDKQADISILRTVGSTPRSVMGIFMVQGTFIGVVGTMAGLALGVALALNVETLVHGLEGLLNTRFLAPDVYFISDLPAEVRWPDVLQICAVAFGLSFLSTLYPAWRAARTQPAEVLRYE